MEDPCGSSGDRCVSDLLPKCPTGVLHRGPPQGSLGNPRKPWIFVYFSGFVWYLLDFLSNIMFFFCQNQVILTKNLNISLKIQKIPQKFKKILKKQRFPRVS